MIESRPRWKRFFFQVSGAVACSAALEVLSLPDAGWSWAALVAPVPLLWVLPELGFGGAFLAGWAAKVLAIAGIFHWLIPTAIELAGFPLAGAVGVWVAFSLAQGLVGGVLGLAIRGTSDLPWPGRWVAIPLAWVAVDAWLPHLFPYGLGHAFWQSPVWMQGAEATGIEGTTFVVVLLAAGLVEWLRHPRDRRGVASLGIAIAVVAGWLGLGALRMEHVLEAEAVAPRIKVLLVQPDIQPSRKTRRDVETRRGIEDLLIRLSDQGGAASHDLVVWPEGAWPWEWDSHRSGTLGDEARRGAAVLADTVARWQRPVLFGTITRPASRSRNSLVLLGPDGVEKARYDKRRLLAFGEYMPLRDVFPSIRGRIRGVGDLEEGDSFVPLEVEPFRLAPSICYEAIHGPLIREAVRATGASILVNLTNDGWFGPSGAPAQHLMVQVPRAVEQRIPLLRDTMTGISAVVEASGVVAVRTGIGEATALSVEVPVPDLGPTLFQRLGPWFAGACGWSTLVLIGWGVGRRRLRPPS